MNSRRRNQSSRRAASPQVEFCQRCGGIISAQHAGASNNACRCTKQQRERNEGETPSPEPAAEQ